MRLKLKRHLQSKRGRLSVRDEIAIARILIENLINEPQADPSKQIENLCLLFEMIERLVKLEWCLDATQSSDSPRT